MKKTVLLLALLSIIFGSAMAQVAVNADGSTANTSAMLDIKSTSKGMLVPRMLTTQRTAISSPANGLMVFDTDTKSFWFYESSSSAWKEIIGTNNNTVVSDGDGDTKIEVEQTNDEDGIHFSTGGKEYFSMQNGRLSINNTGYSVFIGESAGSQDDLSDNANTFVGWKSGFSNTTGSSNTAIGLRSLRDNTSGDYNVSVGRDALMENETGGSNTAVGARSLEDNTEGFYNVAVGTFSLNNNVDGNDNIAIGYSALQNHKQSGPNIAIGKNAMLNDTSGYDNIAIGSSSLVNNINGNNNTALGSSTLQLSEGADENTAIGYSALALSTGGRNTAVGSKALYNNGDGNYNSAMGYKSAYNNTTGGYNTSVGDSSLYSNTTGYLNTAIGHGAMFANTSTWHSVAVGTAAMKNTDGGADNTAVGDSALFSNVSGSYNTAMGNSALQENLGSRNTAVGNDALRNNYGSTNTAIGHEALIKNTSGYSNAAMGSYALADLTTGYNNTVVGNNSGRGITTGDNNTIIGAGVTSLSADLNNNIIIADGEGHQRIRINEDGDIGIGTTNPDTKLHVFSSAAAEPIAHFQSDDDVSIRVNGQGGESYVEIQNDDTGANTWKVGLNDNTKLSLQYGTAGTMNSNTEGLKISTAGYVYKPKMPYFFVEGGNTVVSTGGSSNSVTVNFTSEKFDNGNNFDLSTDKFTAPVHGIYTFSWDIGHNSGQDMGGAYGYFHPGYLETSESSTDDMYWLYFQETSETNAYSMSGIIELNSGEQAWILSQAFGDFEISQSRFSGYLVTALE